MSTHLIDRLTRPILCRIVCLVSAFAFAVSLGGCSTLSNMLDKPSARVTGAHLSDLSLDSVGMVFDVEVSNPYSVALPLTDLAYKLSSSDKEFLSGKASLAAGGVSSIPAKGSKTLQLPATVTFQSLLAAVSSVKPGQVVPYKADMTLSADAPAVGPISLPISHTGQVPVPAVPDVQVTDVKWDKLSLTEAKATMKLDVTNTNQFAVDLSKLAYQLKLDDRDIASSSISKGLKFSPGGKQTLEVPLSFSPQQLGLAALDMLRGKGAGYRILGNIEGVTPFGPVTLPYDKQGKTTFTR